MPSHKITPRLPLLLAALSSAGCYASSTLSNAGREVALVSNEEAPQGCTFVADLASDDWGKDPTHAKVIARNESAELGANYLLMDGIERQRAGGGNSKILYRVVGRAYSCTK